MARRQRASHSAPSRPGREHHRCRSSVSPHRGASARGPLQAADVTLPWRRLPRGDRAGGGSASGRGCRSSRCRRDQRSALFATPITSAAVPLRLRTPRASSRCWRHRTAGSPTGTTRRPPESERRTRSSGTSLVPMTTSAAAAVEHHRSGSTVPGPTQKRFSPWAASSRGGDAPWRWLPRGDAKGGGSSSRGAAPPIATTLVALEQQSARCATPVGPQRRSGPFDDDGGPQPAAARPEPSERLRRRREAGDIHGSGPYRAPAADVAAKAGVTRQSTNSAPNRPETPSGGRSTRLSPAGASASSGALQAAEVSPGAEPPLEAAGLAAIVGRWSGREDLNLRPHGPEPCALPS